MQSGNRRWRTDKNRRTRLNLRTARRGSRKRFNVSRLLGIAGIILAVAAVALFINYLVQGERTRQEQATQRELFRTAAAGEQQTQAQPPETGAADTGISAAQETSSDAGAPADQTNEVSVPAQDYNLAGSFDFSATERQAIDDRFLPLMRRNNDTVGWLSYPMIPEIDFAVVQRDNDHYMYRSFTGEKNVAGTVFLDQSNAVRPGDQNLILHGHNMKNGTMFGKLHRLMDPVMLKTQPFFTFDTLYQDMRYVPVALTVFSVNPNNALYFDVIKTNFDTPDDMGNYVNWMRQHSALSFPTQVYTQDRLLTLVTCHGNDEDERLALVLRAVRPGEDMDALKQQLAAGIKKP